MLKGIPTNLSPDLFTFNKILSEFKENEIQTEYLDRLALCNSGLE